MVELYIENNGNLYAPLLAEGVRWSTSRQGVPGTLTFSVVKDGTINFTEGNTVMLKIGGTDLFYGFVFTKKRTKKNTIDVTAYDQLRYLKNKDTFAFADVTASEIIQFLAQEFQLNLGTIEDTGFRIESRVENNQTLFDMIQTALDITLVNTKNLYVLFDDFSKLTLKNISSMVVPIVIDSETAEDFDYATSIDNDTYNQVRLMYENSETGTRDFYIAKHGENINKWGLLQYFDTLNEGEDGQEKADALLSLYNAKTRTLTLKNVFGDVRVRAGCSVVLQLNLGDIILQDLLVVEHCKHTFSENLHLMELTLKGGDFVG